jgi:hypothetical protein
MTPGAGTDRTSTALRTVDGERPEVLGLLRQRERVVGGPPEPVPGPGQQLYDVPTPGVNDADTQPLAVVTTY